MATTEIEIIPIGGYSDFGRNMTAVRVGREIVLFDMGVKLDPLQALGPDGGGVDELDAKQLRDIGAIPDDSILREVDGKVVAIVISHAHADHVAAVAKLAGHYKDAPIIGSAYTVAYVEDLATPYEARQPRRGRGGSGSGGGERHRGGDKPAKKPRLTIPNELVTLKTKEKYAIGSGKLSIELVHITHSIPGSTLPVLHTPKGAIVYGLDFKLDDTPVLGEKPDYRRLAELGREGVHALIVEATNSTNDVKTDSEFIARLRLKDLLFGVDHERESIFITTFSSNAARIHSAIDYARDLDRDVLILGRSMERYLRIAGDHGHIQIPDSVEMVPLGQQVQNALKRVQSERDRYVVVLTGHQGEPGALLTRMAGKETPYQFSKNDHVIFSSNVIPTTTCITQRADLESRLKAQSVRVLKGAHASGHGSVVDHQELLWLLNPEHIIPCHGGLDLQSAYAAMAESEGWRMGKELHVLANHQRFLLGKEQSPIVRHVGAKPGGGKSGLVMTSPAEEAGHHRGAKPGRERQRGGGRGRR